MLRRIVAALAGIAVALAIIYFLEWIVGMIYPAPSTKDFDDAHVLERILLQIPRTTQVCLLLGYAAASFVGGLVATIISMREFSWPSVTVGVACLVNALFNFSQMPRPIKFMIASLCIYIPFAFLGYFVIRRKSRRAVS